MSLLFFRKMIKNLIFASLFLAAAWALPVHEEHHLEKVVKFIKQAMAFQIN